MPNSLAGRVAVITGAGRGLGREHALLYAAEGAKVVVNDPGSSSDGSDGSSGSDLGPATEVVAEVVAEITARGGEAVANTDSVADWDGARRIVETAIETYGDLHVVVNNAGIMRDRRLLDLTEDDLNSVLDVHLKGTVAVMHWAARHWRDRFVAGDRIDRAIVNTTSGSGMHNPLPTHLNYAAAKAGVSAATIVAALELGHYGVRANAIAPSRARTRLTDSLLPARDASERDPFDPGNLSPLYAYLGSSDCPHTGQVFWAYDNTVTLCTRWALGEQVEYDPAHPTSPIDDLAEALKRLPTDDPVELFAKAMGVLDGMDGRAMLERLLGGAD